ncbi:MAG: beta-ketoacyl synthase chain length factor [Caldimonas sp.]
MSNTARGGSFCVDGIAFWAPTLPGWAAARAAFRGEAEPLATPVKRPAPEILAPAERRRAPDTVALALEAAAAAVRESGLDAAALPSIFTSAHGDLAINDYMCSTLASEPTSISPTKFHNSVHNAAAGYWTMATGCHEASTALSAFDASFGAGLLEAAIQCQTDARPVLLVAFDVAATGALASVTESTGLLACALVLSPRAGARTVAMFDWSLAGGDGRAAPIRSTAARSVAGNAMSGALPLLEAIATPRDDMTVSLSLTPKLMLMLASRTVIGREEHR